MFYILEKMRLLDPVTQRVQLSISSLREVRYERAAPKSPLLAFEIC